MSPCTEKHQTEKPSCKRQQQINESHHITKTNQSFSPFVDESSKHEKEITGAASVENTDTVTFPLSSSKVNDGIDEISQLVSSGDESESNSRKRRLSKRSKSIEIAIEPTAPLPDVDENISPDEFLLKLVDAQLGYKLEPKKATEMKDFFHKSTDAEVAAYTTEVVSAVRDEDLDRLQNMQENGQELNCFNRFGETLLNLACRRGFEPIVRYLMDQPGVTVKTSDDCGRTPLHDACWHPQPQLNICRWIFEEEPALFFIMDKRGCTAFEYARPEHWPLWRNFLFDNRQCLDRLKDPAVRSMLSKA